MSLLRRVSLHFLYLSLNPSPQYVIFFSSLGRRGSKVKRSEENIEGQMRPDTIEPLLYSDRHWPEVHHMYEPHIWNMAVRLRPFYL